MKKAVIISALLFFLAPLSTHAFKETIWLKGKVRGNAGGEVVTLILERIGGGGPEMETSTNKFGQFAFSDMGQGSPSDYRLVVLVGSREVKRVSLSGVSKGGFVPISIR